MCVRVLVDCDDLAKLCLQIFHFCITLDQMESWVLFMMNK